MTVVQKDFRVRQVPLSKLRVSDENPRKISGDRLEQLKQNLAADPEMLEARPLIALPDGTVIAGNMRLRAAAELGWERIPVVTVDLDRERARLWMLRDNHGFGEWDPDPLASLLGELRDAGADLALTGFDAGELDRLLGSLTVLPDALGDPDAVPDAPAEPVSVRGEVYELGPHRLMCGDSTDANDVDVLLGGDVGRVEAVWTDPPYGVNYVGKTADALTIQNDTELGLREFLAAAFFQADRGLAPLGRFYVAAPAGPRGTDFRLALGDVSWTHHQTLVWVKNVMVLGHSDHHYRHEDVLYGWKPGQGRAGRGNHDGTRWYGGHDKTTVFEVDKPARNGEHPTMKPVELIEAMLSNSKLPGDMVFDPFGGSGSTMMACHRLGRRALLMELDPRYCDVIRNRYAEFTGEAKWAVR